MRLYYTFGAAALFSTALFAAATTDTPPDVKVVEEIVAKVNGDIITRGELEKTHALIEAELKKQGKSGAELNKDLQTMEADALRDKIDQLLLVARGKELDVKVDAEITRRIAQVQAQSGIADVDKFHQWVFDQIGISFEDWKQQMTDGELTRRVIGQEVGSHINVPKEELQDYYEKHKSEFVRQEQVLLREILISKGDNSPAAVAAAQKKAEDLVKRARKGEKFPDLARTYSDAETAKNEGELGAFKKGDLIKELEDVVFKMPKGAITDPIQTKVGFEILKVEEHYNAGQASFDDVKDEIMEKLYTPRMQPELRKYLTKLREDAFIQIRGGYVDSGAAPGKDTSWKDPSTLKPETTTKEEVAAHTKRKKHILGVPVPFSGKTTPDVVTPGSPAASTPAASPASAAPAAPTAPATTPAAAPATK
ncbi:MAG TPA: peptidylprolyl isomerase [Bryobacteraceae bacterium]